MDLVEDEGKVVVSQRRASGAFELVRGKPSFHPMEYLLLTMAVLQVRW